MAQENVEAAKQAIDRFNRRDLSGWDEEYAPDYEFYPRLIGAVEGESFPGRKGAERYHETMANIFEEWRVVGEEFQDLRERVLVRARIEGRGKGSGVPVVGWQSLLFDFRDGKICQVRSYLDEGEALKALGQEE